MIGLISSGYCFLCLYKRLKNALYLKKKLKMISHLFPRQKSLGNSLRPQKLLLSPDKSCRKYLCHNKKRNWLFTRSAFVIDEKNYLDNFPKPHIFFKIRALSRLLFIVMIGCTANVAFHRHNWSYFFQSKQIFPLQFLCLLILRFEFSFSKFSLKSTIILSFLDQFF